MKFNARKSITLLALLTLLMTACSRAATTAPAVPTIVSITAAPAATAVAEPTSTASASRYVITDVAIVDVVSGSVVPGQTVIVAGDRIDKIGAQGKLDIPEGAEIIDGQRLYLMPGLVDAHVHYNDAPVFGRLMVANGVLLVRDVGMPTDFILKLRDELNRGDALGPEMIATGSILDGYPPLIPSISVGIRTPDQGRVAVREHVAAGVDEIKVYANLNKDEFLAIVDEARKSGIKVVAHLGDSVSIEDAAVAGIASSEHWFGFEKAIAVLLGQADKLTHTGMGSDSAYLRRYAEVDPQALQDFYQRLRASGLTVCPTVVTFKVGTDIKGFQAGSFPHSEFVSKQVLETWKSQWANQENAPDYIWKNWAQMVKQLNEAGIPLMVGTDLALPGIIPGYSVHDEMAIWQGAGIPTADVLRSATIVPAQFMGLGDRLGSIQVGKTASMVLLAANPLEDIHNAQEIEGVFLRGEYFSREDLDRLLVEAQDLAQRSSP